METAAVSAGRRSGDLVHPLPYAPEFFSKEFSSKIADMRNSVKDRSNAQASCAGQFIANHLDAGWTKKRNAAAATGARAEDDGEGADGDEDGDEDGARGGAAGGGTGRRWLHVDMAGPSTWKGDRGTGYGVPLLVELLTGDFFSAAGKPEKSTPAAAAAATSMDKQ